MTQSITFDQRILSSGISIRKTLASSRATVSVDDCNSLTGVLSPAEVKTVTTILKFIYVYVSIPCELKIVDAADNEITLTINRTFSIIANVKSITITNTDDEKNANFTIIYS